MIYINSKKIDKILSINIEDICFVFDFDRTITKAGSETSWSVIENNDLINPMYKVESQQLYDFYRKIEIDNSVNNDFKISMMDEWTKKQLLLLNKYNINELLFNKLLSYSDKIKFRYGLDVFFKHTYELNIPVAVVSAGLGNSVEASLKQNNCLYENIVVISNMLKFNCNEIMIKGNLINSINKNNIQVPKVFIDKIKNKKNLVLFGDQIDDLRVSQNFDIPDMISVGFLSYDTNKYFEIYKDNFDIICTECENYINLNKILIKKDFEYIKKLERF